MIHRTALAAGAFLISAGAVMLVGTSNPAVGDAIISALRLWPLALIALGVALLLRRTRLGIAGTVLAAAIPGLLLGGVVVAAPSLPGPICTDAGGRPAITHDGTFGSRATVDLEIACGDLTVATAPGTAWSTSTAELGDRTATVTATSDGLTVATGTDTRPFRWQAGGDAWAVTLPTGTTIDLQAAVKAGHGTFDLAGAHLGDVDLEVDAGSSVVDLSSATLDELSISTHAGSTSVRLPLDDVTGRIDAAAGSVELCTQPGLGLRIAGDAVLGSIDTEGLVRVGNAWQTPDYPSATAHVDVEVDVQAGSVAIDPAGGCK